MLPQARLIMNNIAIYKQNIAVTFELNDIFHLEINNFAYDGINQLKK